jgi:hypothetical protein
MRSHVDLQERPEPAWPAAASWEAQLWGCWLIVGESRRPTANTTTYLWSGYTWSVSTVRDDIVDIVEAPVPMMRAEASIDRDRAGPWLAHREREIEAAERPEMGLELAKGSQS